MEVNIQWLPVIRVMLPELLIQVFGDANILEHPLQFAGVLEAAGLFQFGDHGGLCVVARGHVLDKTLGQHLAVKLLEHVFILDVFENDHLKRGDYKKLVNPG